MSPPAPSPAPAPSLRELASRATGVFQYTGRALRLVWQTSRPLTAVLGGLTLIAGLVPGAIAYVGKLLVDAVVAAATSSTAELPMEALQWVAVELVLVAVLAACQKALDTAQSLLRAQLGHRVNVLILQKALQMDLAQFEDASFYDAMTKARREASSRPLSMVRRTFGLIQNSLALTTYGALLLAFSPWAVAVLAAAAVPSFVAETRFAGQAFRLFSWRSPEKRKQAYLETVVAREDYAKEVQLLELGPTLVDRYDQIFHDLYAEDRSLTLRRGGWGYVLGLLSHLALYGAYTWVVLEAARGVLSVGDMTMYLMVFRQGQAAFTAILQAIGGLYEDNLYLSTLSEFLDRPTPEHSGTATVGPDPGDGLRIEDVWFTYPGADDPALRGVSLHLRPGDKLALVGHNGSGKTTLVKLITRLYPAQKGRITLDGLPLQDWDVTTLRRRVGVIFQDFVRYQFTVGENITLGDVTQQDNTQRRDEAAERGMAQPVVDAMPKGYETQLGRWFPGGRELSGGQWQKVALSRAFMRGDADLLILDEPTAAMDAEAEAEIYQRLADLTEHRMAILISHRFSTVRMADRIVVLDAGQVTESGSHETLLSDGGTYARLFELQAAGYQ